MDIETIWIIIIEIILFLIASYFLFYKAWLKALGKEVAKLTTVADLTKLKEEVKADFNKNLETYKKELNEELALKIEPLKSDLAKSNITHQIQLSYLYKERAIALVSIYRKLQDLHFRMIDLTQPIQIVRNDSTEEEHSRLKNITDALYEFKMTYMENRLLLSEEFCKTIDEVMKDYSDKGYDYSYRMARMKSEDLPADYWKKYSEDMSEISAEVREKFPAKIVAIEKKCREILRGEGEI